MAQAVTRSSRFLALSGIAAVIFGIAAIVWPNITVVVLVALFGAYAFVAGVFTLVAGLDMATEGARHWVPLVLGGIGGIAIGAVTFFRPGITAVALIFLIAAWAIVIGVFEFVAGVELTGSAPGAWTLWLGGLISVAFGVVVALRPGSGALAIIWLIGLYAIVTGVIRLGFAFWMRTARADVKSAVGRLTGAPTR